MIYDLRAAARQLYRALKPGGVLLATVPGISQISRYDMERWGDYWRFTSLSARRLIEEAGSMEVTVRTYGNVLSAIAFLHGLAADELREKELNYSDRRLRAPHRNQGCEGGDCKRMLNRFTSLRRLRRRFAVTALGCPGSPLSPRDRIAVRPAAVVCHAAAFQRAPRGPGRALPPVESPAVHRWIQPRAASIARGRADL